MDEEITVTQTTLHVSQWDKLAVATLSMLAGLATTALAEKGYFAAKSRYLVRKSHISD